MTSLSAFLAEIEKNSTYTNAAIASANWIKNHNLNPDYLVLDTVNAHNCTTSPSTELFTYNSGKFVEGLSVLATVTGDSQWSDLALNITNAAVKTSVWADDDDDDGIITEGSETSENSDEVGFKGVVFRAI
jgi:predicted alpha-1,6-mannanase (GH76 family)